MAIILCVGASARFYRLGDKSLWLDEIMSVRLARMDTPVQVVSEVASYDAHPPLYPLVHYLFMRAGDSEFSARTPSALFGALTIVAMYLFASRLFGRGGGLTASALMALSAYHIYFSQEARHYSLVMFLAVTLSWLLLILIDPDEKPPRWAWIAYAITGAALLYTFVMGILLIVAHWAVFLICASRTRSMIIRGLATQLCIGAAFVPWLPSLVEAQRRVSFIAEVKGAEPSPGIADMLDALGQWMLGGSLQPFGNPLWLSIPAAAIFILSLIAIHKKRRELIVAASLIILPMLIFLLLPIERAHRFNPKHLAFIAPFVIAAPAALTVAWRRSKYAGVLIPICVVIINIGMASGYFDPAFEKDSWPEAAEHIMSEGGGEFILVNPERGAPQALQRYYRGELEIRAGTVGPFVPRDAELAIEFDRVWLITCWNEVLSPTPGLIDWFEANTRRISEEYFLNKPPEMYPNYPPRIIRCALYERIDASPRD